MRRRFIILLTIITVFLVTFIAVNLTNLSIARAQSVTQWEYLYINANIDKQSGGYGFFAFPATDRETLNQALAEFGGKSVTLTLGDQSLTVPDYTSVTQALNYLGGSGWELINIQPVDGQLTTTFYFKRPVQS